MIFVAIHQIGLLGHSRLSKLPMTSLHSTILALVLVQSLGQDTDENYVSAEIKADAIYAIELAFHLAAQSGVVFILFVAIVAGITLGFQLIYNCCACCRRCIGCFKKPVYYLGSSYCGLLYLMYFITIPFLGFPPRGKWLRPPAPHFSPALYWTTKEKRPRKGCCKKRRQDNRGSGEESGAESGDSAPALGVTFIHVSTVRQIVNGIALAFYPYIVIMVVMIVMGAFLVVPIVVCLMGTLTIIARVSHNIVRLRGPHLEKQKKLKKPKNEGDLNPLKQKIKNCILNYLMPMFEMMLQSLSICIFFFLDFMVLFSIFITFAATFPSLAMNLGISLSLPSLKFFGWDINFNLPSLPGFTIPSFTFRCGSFRNLSALLNLFATMFAVSVVISSDVVACVYDRYSRLKSMKADEAESLLGKIIAKMSHNTILKMVFFCQWAVWQVVIVLTNQGSIFLMETSTTWFDMVKNASETRWASPLGDNKTTFEEMVTPADEECTVGTWFLAMVLSVYILCATLTYIVRVLNGQVYEDGAYFIMSALVQEERLCTRTSLKRMIMIVKLSVGGFLMPFLDLALTEQQLHALKDASLSNRRMAKAYTPEGREALIEEVLKAGREPELEPDEEDARDEPVARRSCRQRCCSFPLLRMVANNVIQSFTAVFTTSHALIEALLDLEIREEYMGKSEKEILAILNKRYSTERSLASVDDFRLGQFMTEMCNTHEELKNSPFCQHMRTMVCLPIGVFNGSSFDTTHTSERCILWQGSLEQVHRATGNSVGVSIFAVPFAGPFLGKMVTYLNEVPAWVNSDGSEAAVAYSLRRKLVESDGSEAQLGDSAAGAAADASEVVVDSPPDVVDVGDDADVPDAGDAPNVGESPDAGDSPDVDSPDAGPQDAAEAEQGAPAADDLEQTTPPQKEYSVYGSLWLKLIYLCNIVKSGLLFAAVFSPANLFIFLAVLYFVGLAQAKLVRIENKANGFDELPKDAGDGEEEEGGEETEEPTGALSFQPTMEEPGEGNSENPASEGQQSGNAGCFSCCA